MNLAGEPEDSVLAGADQELLLYDRFVELFQLETDLSGFLLRFCSGCERADADRVENITLVVLNDFHIGAVLQQLCRAGVGVLADSEGADLDAEGASRRRASCRGCRDR